MNKDSWLYRLSKAYLLGAGIAGIAVCLLQTVHPIQFLTGFTLTVVGWIHLRDAYRAVKAEREMMSENNNKKR
ncbi:hypothetical protein CL634_00420 [bacterium]|nr:hypothetical protein [bacterium]